MTPFFDRKTIFVAVAAAAVALPLAVVSYAGMRKQDRREGCVQNLVRIGMVVASGSPRALEAWDALPPGRNFFAAAANWPVQPTFPTGPALFSCPVRGMPGTVDYRGPSRSVRLLDPRAALAADRLGNHGPGEGGNVLRRSGEVVPCDETDDEWVRAAETTAD